MVLDSVRQRLRPPVLGDDYDPETGLPRPASRDSAESHRRSDRGRLQQVAVDWMV
jgi:hypothetical protein